MARPPRKTAAPAKKAAAPRKRASPSSPEGVVVETLLNNATVKITRTTMQPGAIIPPVPRPADYVIHPVNAFTCLRRHMRGEKVTREVPLTGTPGKPYYARATAPGRHFALVNTGSEPAIFDKTVLKSTTTKP